MEEVYNDYPIRYDRCRISCLHAHGISDLPVGNGHGLQHSNPSSAMAHPPADLVSPEAAPKVPTRPRSRPLRIAALVHRAAPAVPTAQGATSAAGEEGLGSDRHSLQSPGCHAHAPLTSHDEHHRVSRGLDGGLPLTSDVPSPLSSNHSVPDMHAV